jgi:UDP-GlcNAc:undecaprenyl-phosphate GlcNAc-1-phosphate transferase
MLLTAALTPLVMRFARQFGAVDEGGYRKVYRGPIPLLGGLGIAIPLIALFLAATTAGCLIFPGDKWVWVRLHLTEHIDPIFTLASNRNRYMVLTIGGAGIVALGLVDDIKGLGARRKFVGQIIVALFVCLSGYSLTTVTIPLLGTVSFGPGLGGLVTVLWLVGLINAFNLIDGVDGLATGIGLIGAGALFALGIIQENQFVILTTAAIAGGLLAFLFYNFPPAKVFLGDTGSLFIGFILATVSLMGSQKLETTAIMIAPLLALSFPIFETLVSMLRRYLRGVPVFSGDDLHTHHRLLGKGYSQPQVVLTLYTVAVFLALAAVLPAAFPADSMWAWLSFALYAVTLLSIAWVAGYFRPIAFRTAYDRRRRNKIYQALRRYAEASLKYSGCPIKINLLTQLCRHELQLHYLEVRKGDGGLLMASSGTKNEQNSQTAREDVLVRSADLQDLLVCYEFDRSLNDHRRRDVSFCLASIFDQLQLAKKGEDSE